MGNCKVKLSFDPEHFWKPFSNFEDDAHVVRGSGPEQNILDVLPPLLPGQ